MKCPYCGYAESKVIDSRPTDEDSRIRRRRECLSCANRFTTYEAVENLPIIVVKRPVAGIIRPEQAIQWYAAGL